MTENPLLAGIHGALGKTFVIKQYKDKVVYANFPRRSRKKPTATQKDQRQLFKEAVMYAKMILRDPKQKKAYERKLKGKRTVYHAALAEYLAAERLRIEKLKAHTKK